MSVKTRQDKTISLQERGDLSDLFASALVHIRGNKRSKDQRKNLRRALQLFDENRLDSEACKYFWYEDWDGVQVHKGWKEAFSQLGFPTIASLSEKTREELESSLRVVVPKNEMLESLGIDEGLQWFVRALKVLKMKGLVPLGEIGPTTPALARRIQDLNLDPRICSKLEFHLKADRVYELVPHTRKRLVRFLPLQWAYEVENALEGIGLTLGMHP